MSQRISEYILYDEITKNFQAKSLTLANVTRNAVDAAKRAVLALHLLHHVIDMHDYIKRSTVLHIKSLTVFTCIVQLMQQCQ